MNKSSRFVQLAVGLFFITGVAILACFTIILSSNNFFGANHLYIIDFQDIGGLTKGNDVRLHGVSVGKVKEITIVGDDNDKVSVVMNLDKPLTFYTDHSIIVRNSSVLGGQYLSIKLGSSINSKASLPLRGQLPINIITKIEDLIVEFEESGIIGNAKNFMEQLDLISKSIIRKNIVNNIADTIEGYKSFGNFANGIIKDLKNGKGTVGKLLNNDDAYNKMITILENTSSTFKNANDIIVNLKQGKGSLGKILTDDKLYDNLNKTFNGASAAIEDFREQAPIQTFGSIIFNAL